ncbi:MAG: S8 family serine peptidase [Candidatus Woesearchaeota archaeon]
MKKSVVVAMLLFFLLVYIAFSENDDDNKVDKEVEDKLKQQDEVSVIVVLEDDYDVLNDVSAFESKREGSLEKKKVMIAEQQEKVLSKLNYEEGSLKKGVIGKKSLKIEALEINNDEKIDFKLKSKFTSVNGFSGEVTKEGLEKLKNDPNVIAIDFDRPIHAFLDTSKNHVNATSTWRLIYNNTNLTGKGETICIIDTGVDYNHLNLGNGWGNKVISGYRSLSNGGDQQECNSNPSACLDEYGHGTHVAGIVASNHSIYTGIAPDANIIAVKVLDSSGGGYTSDLIRGITWCTNNASVFNITVISMSLGDGNNFTNHCNTEASVSSALVTAIDNAFGQNISVIAAAGNEYNFTGMSSPACIANVTSVGAVNDNDIIASFSSRNGNTSLFAPGVDIISLKSGGGTIEFGGTSMAAPMVAGAFALIHQYFKSTENKVVMPNETQRYLNDTGKQITDSGGSGLTFSRINIFAAIESLDTLSPIITITNPENNSIKTNLSFIVNITSDEVLANATLEVNNTNFTMAGSGTKWSLNVSSLVDRTYIYKIYGNDTFGNVGMSERTINIVDVTIPIVLNVNISSTDVLNRTNGSITGTWEYFDPNDDAAANETKWYNNSLEVLELRNSISVSPQNTTKDQNWIFSVRVSDGTNWSDWANSTNLTINNAAPEINITISNVIINETQKVNITTNASDIDNDALRFTINDTRFSLDGIYFIWNTNLTDSGNYPVNITVNDTEGIDSKIITVIVSDARDLDNDGNPDFNDTDDDNDGISDENDFLSGNLSKINTTSTIKITINGTTNLTKLFNGTFFINITNGTNPIVEFNFTFNKNNILDLGSITFNRTTNGSSAVSIRGINLAGMNKTKTFFLEKINTTVSAVCVKDIDTSFDTISSACDGSSEILVNCNNQTTNSYVCFDTGMRYKVTGLNHSAVKELCRDNDGDGYGTGCSAGTDSCDNNPSQHTSSGCNPPSNDNGGSSSSGGGGGGGGSPFFVCNKDWVCGEWSDCIKDVQIRECNFVKVAQHTQSERCPEESKVPETRIACTTSKVTGFAAESANTTKTEERNETVAAKQEKSEQKPGGILSAITGAVTRVFANLNGIQELKVTGVVIVVLLGAGVYYFRRKRVKIRKHKLKK